MAPALTQIRINGGALPPQSQAPSSQKVTISMGAPPVPILAPASSKIVLPQTAAVVDPAIISIDTAPQTSDTQVQIPVPTHTSTQVTLQAAPSGQSRVQLGAETEAQSAMNASLKMINAGGAPDHF